MANRLRHCLSALFLGSTLLSAAPAWAQKTYLHCGRLLDMRQDRAQSEMTLVVEKGRVVAVEKGYTTPTGTANTVIDLKNRTVLPGLIDCHVHLESETSKDNFLQELTELRCLYLRGNEFVSSMRNYRKTFIAALPGLTYLDDRPICDVERRAAAAWWAHLRQLRLH